MCLKQLADDFAQYLYLPRLKDTEVLLAAVKDGLALTTWEQDTFAYAESWDEARGRYVGLRAGQFVPVAANGASVLVKPEVAAKQIEADRPQPPAMVAPSYPKASGGTDPEVRIRDDEFPGRETVAPPPAPRLTRFHGSVALDASRLGRDAGKIAEEVVQHLSTLTGARVEVTLEIQVEIPDGAPDHVVRTVTENCRTLRFRDFGFEEL